MVQEENSSITPDGGGKEKEKKNYEATGPWFQSNSVFITVF
jgi:hypothetical protein